MNILHVITGMQKAAGTSVFCGEVCNGLVASGHDVTIAVANPTAADCYPLDPRIKLISISSLLNNSTRSTRSSAAVALAKVATRLNNSKLQTSNFELQTSNFELQTSNFKLIHIHALWSPLLHKVAKWAQQNGIPIVWSPHGMLTPWAMNNKKWKKLLGWWLYQKWDLMKANLIHATAQSEVEDIRRMGLKNKVMVAPLGVNISLKFEVQSLKLKREEAPKKTILFVSRVQRKKGLINLVKAWSILKNQTSNSKLQTSNFKLQTSNWHIRIVGPDQDNHTAELKLLCAELSVENDFEFVGPKYGDELAREYASADLFVLPTHSENFGSVVIEALAHGVPVISTKGAPWAELESEKCGKWIEIGVEPLAAALQECMAMSDDERRQMGENGLRLVEKKYTWDAVVKEMVQGYESLVIIAPAINGVEPQSTQRP